MNEQQFTQLLGGIDPALIARAEAPVPMRKKPRFKLILIAAVLALLACTALVITPFIPTTLGIDYITSPIDGTETAFKERNVWIYYTTESGKKKREYVRLPGDNQNVFAAWAHLNGLGEQYELHGIEYTDVSTQLGPYVDIVCSAALRDHPESDTLRSSLQKTFARYLGIPENQVTVLFADPITTLNGAEFYAFMEQYGFATADASEFRAAVESLTYQGQGLLDVMTETPVDFEDGYHGQEWHSEFFDYSYLITPDQSCSNLFSAAALPDGMTLPYSIAPGDTLLDSLCKMGMTQNQAQSTLEQLQSFSGDSLRISLAQFGTLTFCAPRTSNKTYTVRYSFTADPLADHLDAPEISLTLIYSADDITFKYFRIDTEYESMIKHEWQIAPSDIALLYHRTNLPLSSETTSKLLDAYSDRVWRYSDQLPDSGTLDFSCGDHTLSYLANEGILIADDLWYTEVAQSKQDYFNALANALNGWQVYYNSPPKYIMIVYVDGRYFGHNNTVTEPDVGEVIIDPGIIWGPTTQEHFVAVHDTIDLAPYLDQYINYYEGMIHINGAWFEEITMSSESKITVTKNDQTAFTIEQNADLVLSILQRQQWSEGVLDLAYNVSGKIECSDSRFTGNFRYNSYKKIFMINQKYCTLSDEDAADLHHIINDALVAPKIESFFEIRVWSGGKHEYALDDHACSEFFDIFNAATWEFNAEFLSGSANDQTIYISTDKGMQVWEYDVEGGTLSSGFYLGTLNEEQEQGMLCILGMVEE